MLHAVIMAGGAGTRFWPASRVNRPKQLLPLAGERTMIQATCDRLAGLVEPDRILVVTNANLTRAIGEQLPDVPPSAIVGEPCKRDTAPCVGLSAMWIARRDPDAVLVVMPADHVIEPREAFQQAIGDAVRLVDACSDPLVTFGIRPTYPATHYGYIERGEPWEGAGGTIAAHRVARFREKPAKDVAEQFLATGRFYWNAGIFVWRARTILDAIKSFEPEMYGRLAKIFEGGSDARFQERFEEQFEAIQGKSIDYAVLERHPRVVVIEPEFSWDDVGNWGSLARTRGADDQGNTIIGRHVGIDTRDAIVCSDDRHVVVTVGLRDCVIVHTPDATLVADRRDEEAMRQVVDRLRKLGWTEYL
ncbi:MAG: mannose-1-phosphate guanylyltransferase [Planctomycetes bacterium]|nr:mannose-1-phosphate guanylyltransferase [Planctomycetota bacterium]